MDLVVLAGGMGSRFGGAKQIEGIDENNNFIMDYSIFDAIKSGFNKIVVIIKPEYQNIFENTIGKRIGDKCKLVFVKQEMDNASLEKFGVKREKPLGTGHAVLCTKNFVKDNFCIVNADDFYGKGSYLVASDYLKSIKTTSTNFALVGYKLKNTMSETGSVKRGICKIKNGYVEKIDECSVEYKNNIPVANLLDSNENVLVDGSEVTSMNMFCLTPMFFDYLQKKYDEFVSSKENLETKEFLLPRVIADMVKEKKATLKALSTDEKWIGMTYKDDKKDVVERLKKLSQAGIYPTNLWK